MSTNNTTKKLGCLGMLVIGLFVLVSIGGAKNAVTSPAPPPPAAIDLMPTVTPTPAPPTATPLPTPTPDPALPRTDVDARLACMMAEEFVTPNLKAPATAQFSGFEESCRAYFADGVWTIRSYVDSQNGFGALIRTGYVAKLTYTPDDEMWHLQDLVFSE